ncbi:MAG: ribosomal L7Ae/L30e/S12e/Gadd45 family protein [Ruminococcus sp.]|nr:ribosomal L7Ae/L30e/S12e/Gadd45 family protein [Ruminococcus sp.]
MNGNNEKLFGLLSICRRAGRMTTGFDSCRESMEKGKAKLVVLASDISPKSEKEARFFGDKYGVAVIKTAASRKEFAEGLGKETVVCAICDDGFAKRTAELAGDS